MEHEEPLPTVTATTRKPIYRQVKVMVCHLTRPLLNGDFDCFQTLFITVLQQTSLDVIDIS